MTQPSQTRLPDWYPDPHHPGLLRWWDGKNFTQATQPAPGDNDPSEPATIPQQMIWASRVTPREDKAWPIPSHAPLIAGILFMVAGVLAGIQAVYMTGLFSVRGFLTTGWGLPIALPFDWYLTLFPYWGPMRAFFTWGLVPPTLVLAGCAVASFVFGRRKPRTAILVIASLLTVQNLLILIPLFLDAGGPGMQRLPIFRPDVFAQAGFTDVLVAVVVVHVVVWAIPVLFAASTVGSQSTRIGGSRVFLLVSGLYFLGSVAVLIFGRPETRYFLTPGIPQHAGAWLSPMSTLLCLVAMALFQLPSLRTSKPS